MSLLINSIVYLSTPTHVFSQQDLDGLLEISRKNNYLYDVTGILISRKEAFLQFIEGPSFSVDVIFRKIAADPRHKLLQVWSQDGLNNERLYPSWAMHHMNLDQLIEAEDLLKVTSPFLTAFHGLKTKALLAEAFSEFQLNQ